ncbi:MAG: fumarylacetoacetate hydrolase family protein [Aquiluna sp.]|nr:fumarylacetoacetate hydrolase family protein [Aquiluna sp.]MCF8546131.1 fumarylacetoacetate hydrolase family protein [Aquiluna sp.]
MRIARFSHKNQTRFGIVSESEIEVFQGDPIESMELSGEKLNLSEVKFLAPVTPSKVVCIGLNYSAHAAEIEQDVQKEPLFFFKPSSAIIGIGEEIVLPSQSQQVELEVELVVVIGKTAKNVSKEAANDYIFGYTVGNDVTARDLQFSDLQWARSKAFDTFCPIGPWIETEFSPEKVALSSFVNGEKRQSSRSDDMIFDIPTIISFVSQNITLLPGDIIMTGSPAGISKISHGDLVECEIEGIGVLANPVT